MSPSAPEWLQKEFPGDDSEACNVLEKNFIWDLPKLWIIRRKDLLYTMTEREWHAILYLCEEWDWGYEGD